MQDVSSKIRAKDIFGRGLYRENLSNVGTRIFGGRMGTIDNSVSKTFQITTTLAQHFDKVRLVFANTNAGFAVNNILAKVSVISTVADLNNSAGTWVDVLKSNQPGFCVPNSYGANRISYTVSDWVSLKSIARTDGGTFPLLVARVCIQSVGAGLPVYGQGSSPDVYTNWETKPGGRIWVSRQKNGNHVTNPTGFDDTTNTNQSPIIGVQYLAKGRVVSVMCVGDSIPDGIGTYRGEGFGMPICEQLSDMNGVAFEYSNCAWAGQGTAAYTKRAIDILNSPIKPDILLFATGSPNDVSTVITQGIVDSQSANVETVIQKCKATGVKIVLWTWLPTNTSIKNYGATDSIRVAENAKWMAVKNPDVPVVDTSALLTGDLTAGQYQMLTGTTIDGIHPSDPGLLIMANGIKPTVKNIIGL